MYIGTLDSNPFRFHFVLEYSSLKVQMRGELSECAKLHTSTVTDHDGAIVETEPNKILFLVVLNELPQSPHPTLIVND